MQTLQSIREILEDMKQDGLIENRNTWAAYAKTEGIIFSVVCDRQAEGGFLQTILWLHLPDADKFSPELILTGQGLLKTLPINLVTRYHGNQLFLQNGETSLKIIGGMELVRGTRERGSLYLWNLWTEEYSDTLDYLESFTA